MEILKILKVKLPYNNHATTRNVLKSYLREQERGTCMSLFIALFTVGRLASASVSISRRIDKCYMHMCTHRDGALAVKKNKMPCGGKWMELFYHLFIY